MRTFWVIAVALISAACPQREEGNAQNPPDFASAFHHAVRYERAQRSLVVELQIAPRFHAYTVGEKIGRPLLLELAPDSDFLADGPVAYPKGTTKDLPIGRSVIVEGRAEISVGLRPKGESKGTIKGTLRYHVCTDRACDRPRTAPFSVGVE